VSGDASNPLVPLPLSPSSSMGERESSLLLSRVDMSGHRTTLVDPDLVKTRLADSPRVGGGQSIVEILASSRIV
jgi:hypothetical protein